jgi:hypothetical protein
MLDDRAGPIIANLLSSGGAINETAVTLTEPDRKALANGQLYVQLYTRGGPLGGARAILKICEACGDSSIGK